MSRGGRRRPPPRMSDGTRCRVESELGKDCLPTWMLRVSLPHGLLLSVTERQSSSSRFPLRLRHRRPTPIRARPSAVDRASSAVSLAPLHLHQLQACPAGPKAREAGPRQRAKITLSRSRILISDKRSRRSCIHNLMHTITSLVRRPHPALPHLQPQQAHARAHRATSPPLRPRRRITSVVEAAVVKDRGSMQRRRARCV